VHCGEIFSCPEYGEPRAKRVLCHDCSGGSFVYRQLKEVVHPEPDSLPAQFCHDNPVPGGEAPDILRLKCQLNSRHSRRQSNNTHCLVIGKVDNPLHVGKTQFPFTWAWAKALAQSVMTIYARYSSSRFTRHEIILPTKDMDATSPFVSREKAATIVANNPILRLSIG